MIQDQKQITKRKYNLTYKARKRGCIINSRKKHVIAYFEDITGIVACDFVVQLIRDYGYTVVENTQYKMKLK
jgi:2-phosphoglycerate kinase